MNSVATPAEVMTRYRRLKAAAAALEKKAAALIEGRIPTADEIGRECQLIITDEAGRPIGKVSYYMRREYTVPAALVRRIS